MVFDWCGKLLNCCNLLILADSWLPVAVSRCYKLHGIAIHENTETKVLLLAKVFFLKNLSLHSFRFPDQFGFQIMNFFPMAHKMKYSPEIKFHGWWIVKWIVYLSLSLFIKSWTSERLYTLTLVSLFV